MFRFSLHCDTGNPRVKIIQHQSHWQCDNRNPLHLILYIKSQVLFLFEEKGKSLQKREWKSALEITSDDWYKRFPSFHDLFYQNVRLTTLSQISILPLLFPPYFQNTSAIKTAVILCFCAFFLTSTHLSFYPSRGKAPCLINKVLLLNVWPIELEFKNIYLKWWGRSACEFKNASRS